MKSSRPLLLLLAFIVGLSIVSCAGGPSPQPAAPSQGTAAKSAQPAESAEQPAPVPPKEPPSAAATEPASGQSGAEQPAQQPKQQPNGDRQPIEVSQEVYSKTFDEVEKVIKELNSIISDGDFSAWTSYLTRQYVEEMSKPSTLKAVSESPILKRNNIVLHSLEDYFHYVVVPSRSNARLDDLVFLDENTVEAIMIVRGQRVILYQLEKRDGKWKIGLF
ncbi:hypothetical protein [Salinispira pacifica]